MDALLPCITADGDAQLTEEATQLHSETAAGRLQVVAYRPESARQVMHRSIVA